MSFPHESEPDDEVDGPHHAYIGLMQFLLAAFAVSRAYVPVAGVASALAAWFAFQYIWPFYPRTGALGALGGVGAVGLVTLANAGTWWAASPWWFLVAVVGVAVALDDVAEHAFGIWTPVDAFWRRRLHPAIA